MRADDHLACRRARLLVFRCPPHSGHSQDQHGFPGPVRTSSTVRYGFSSAQYSGCVKTLFPNLESPHGEHLTHGIVSTSHMCPSWQTMVNSIYHFQIRKCIFTQSERVADIQDFGANANCRPKAVIYSNCLNKLFQLSRQIINMGS